MEDINVVIGQDNHHWSLHWSFRDAWSLDRAFWKRGESTLLPERYAEYWWSRQIPEYLQRAYVPAYSTVTYPTPNRMARTSSLKGRNLDEWKRRNPVLSQRELERQAAIMTAHDHTGKPNHKRKGESHDTDHLLQTGNDIDRSVYEQILQFIRFF